MQRNALGPAISLIVVLLPRHDLCVAQEASKPPRKSVARIDSRESLNRWMTLYYQNPQPDLVPDALRFIEEAGSLDSGHASPAFAGFFAILFRENEERLPSWLPEVGKLTGRTRRMAWFALWLSRAETAREFLAKSRVRESGKDKEYLERLVNTEPWVPETKEIRKPSDLDMLWGAFFASGDSVYVRRIISTLAWNRERRDLIKFMTGASAKWSLISNAKRHNRVFEICRKEAERVSGQAAEEIRQVLEWAREEDGLRRVNIETKRVLTQQKEAGVWGSSGKAEQGQGGAAENDE